MLAIAEIADPGSELGTIVFLDRLTIGQDA